MTGSSPNSTSLRHVVTWSAAYDYCHDRYQAYYLAAITTAADAAGAPVIVRHLQRMAGVMRALRRVRSAHRLSGLMNLGLASGVDTLARVIGGHSTPTSGLYHSLVGQYTFEFEDGRTVRLAVDAQDSGEVAAPSLLEQCDVYAKTNYRSDVGYPCKVVPVVNGNPLILPHLSHIRSLRRRPIEYDVCFVVRVWGGHDERAGVEHNLRLLEAVNRVRGRKFLLAYLVAGDLPAIERRLAAQGIPTTRTPMPLHRLWEVSAASRVNVIRLGMHNCLPWRFADVLAMGACVALDQPPQTVWPHPLVPSVHYMDFNAYTPPEGGVAADVDYEQIPGQLERTLSDGSALERMRAAAADYFDTYACPDEVGRSLLGHVFRAMADPTGKAM